MSFVIIIIIFIARQQFSQSLSTSTHQLFIYELFLWVFFLPRKNLPTNLFIDFQFINFSQLIWGGTQKTSTFRVITFFAEFHFFCHMKDISRSKKFNVPDDKWAIYQKRSITKHIIMKRRRKEDCLQYTYFFALLYMLTFILPSDKAVCLTSKNY